MDAWNALWFWPLTDRMTSGVLPPTLEEWISGLKLFWGRQRRNRVQPQEEIVEKPDEYLWTPAAWEDLNTAEDTRTYPLPNSRRRPVHQGGPSLAVRLRGCGRVTRASITGSSTLPPYSPAADLICRWETRRGCGR